MNGDAGVDVGDVVVAGAGAAAAVGSEEGGDSLESRLRRIPVTVAETWTTKSRPLYRLGLCPCAIPYPWCRNFLFELTN